MKVGIKERIGTIGVLILLVSIWGCGSSKPTSSATEKGVVRGYLKFSEGRLTGELSIKVEGTDVVTKPDENGEFVVLLPEGDHVLIVEKPDGTSILQPVRVEKDEETVVYIDLEVRPHPAEPTITIPPSGVLISAELVLDKTSYRVGEPITMVLTVRNERKDVLELNFRDGQTYDFIVSDPTGREVWRWSHDKAFIEVLRSVKLGPGEEMVFKEIWDQKDNNGNQVPPGPYVVIGKIVSTPGAESASKFEIIQ